MANTIDLITKYTGMIDEVYEVEALTTDLDSDMAFAKAGANANEIAIPTMTLQGLADYGRNTGYVDRTMTFEYNTVTYNFDRGGKFSVDAMDDEETQGIAFGMLAGEFERTEVVPEVDAFRFAKYASLHGLGPADVTLADGAAVIAALRVATTQMNANKIPKSGRILYIEDSLSGLWEDLDSTKSREVLKNFSKIVAVPQDRFYTAIDQLDGKTAGEEDGGYAKDVAGKDINFMVIHPKSVLQYTKHKVSLVAGADQNFDADALTYRYRLYALCDAYTNKVAGIYLNNKAT